MNKRKKHNRVRYGVLAVLLLATFAMMLVPGGNAFYAAHIYPIKGTVLSNISSWVPFPIGDLFVILSFLWAILYPLYALINKRKKFSHALGHVVEYLLWLFVWFYWAWGLNYGQPNYYQRTGTQPMAYNEQAFSRFAKRYVQLLNENYTEITAKDEEKVCKNVMAAYKLHGFNRIRNIHPKIKTMLYTPLASMVGVTGSMMPFFCEFTINRDVQPHRFAAIYAHEYAHLQGITSEGEANFYAYLATTQSTDKSIRFSGYYDILGHVFNNAARLMSQEEYKALYESLRPEIKQLIKDDRAYWEARYNQRIGDMQDWLFDKFLKYNKVSSGKKSYSEVIGLIMAYENGD